MPSRIPTPHGAQARKRPAGSRAPRLYVTPFGKHSRDVPPAPTPDPEATAAKLRGTARPTALRRDWAQADRPDPDAGADRPRVKPEAGQDPKARGPEATARRRFRQFRQPTEAHGRAHGSENRVQSSDKFRHGTRQNSVATCREGKTADMRLTLENIGFVGLFA